MNVQELDKAEVFRALYNGAQVFGNGFLKATEGDMTAEEAKAIMEKAGPKPYFDYFRGRVMKIRIENYLETALYNRDNGPGAAEWAILDHFTKPEKKHEEAKT